MFDGSPKLVVGFKWVTYGGAKACARCAELNGQEFYYDPEDGQQSVADMPDPPLHPNCRCKTIAIMDFTTFVEGNVAPVSIADVDDEERAKNPYLYQGATAYFLGGYWCNDGRAISDGPAYGFYGGQNWSAGRNPKNIKPEERDGKKKRPEPADDMDKHFQKHDDGYDKCEISPSPRNCRLECDKELVRNLESLSADPRDWGIPPNTPVKIEDGRNYREWALIYFKGRVWYRTIENTLGVEWAHINYPLLNALFHD